MGLAKGLQLALTPISVCVERSRDTHRNGVRPRGISTSLDANGYGVFMRIGVVAPSTPILLDDSEAVRPVVSLGSPGVELEFDPNCLDVQAHFDNVAATRLHALVHTYKRADNPATPCS